MAFVNPYLVGAIAAAPVIFERLLGHVPEAALDARPDPERFTIREVMCHLADWEPFFLERLQGTVSADDYRIVAYDEGQLAIDHDYAHQDVGAALARFKAGRERYCAYVATLDGAALDRTAYHPERGRLTAGDLIAIVVGHDVYHIEQISARLG